MLYISKANKGRNNKIYTQYQISVYLIFPGFGESQKIGSGVRLTGNETERENLKNSCNDFLLTRYINNLLHVIYNKKIDKSPNLVAKF